jgi:predicted nucleotidyltransferase
MNRSNPFSSLSPESLAEPVQRLTAALHPYAIYLFGSHVHGVPQADSDIDLMVIVEDEPLTVEHHRLGYRCLRGMGLPVELHLCTRARFDRFANVIGSIQYDVRRKGVLIYAAEA